MKWRRFIPHILLFFGGLGYALWSFVRRPFPMLGDSPLLDLMDYHTPNFYGWVMLWYYASPFVAVMLAGLVLLSVWKVWLESRRRDFAPFGALPTWPLSTRQTAPAIVIGEVHHPVEAREIFNPSWLTIPERGLYTGVAIFGAVGSGKTSACMHPFARQLLSWQAGESTEAGGGAHARSQGRFLSRYPANPDRDGPGKRLHRAWHEGPLAMEPALGLVARFLLAGLHRFEPCSTSCSGRARNPSGSKPIPTLVRWIIELHRIFPERWVTLQQVYRCAIDPDLFAAKIEQAEAWSDELNKGTVFIPEVVYQAHIMTLAEWLWKDIPGTEEVRAAYSRPMLNKLDELKLTYRVVWDPGPGDDVRERVEAVKRWFVNDWQTLDNKVKSSIVEGVSVFLAMFDMPDVAKVFCPGPPEVPDDPQAIAVQARAAMRAAGKKPRS